MVDFFAALHPRTVKRWQPKLLLGFSAETQAWFDERWADVRPLAEAGWFTYVALSPLLEAVTLPLDFRALGKWVVVYGECTRKGRLSTVSRWRPIGRVPSATNVERQEYFSSFGGCTRADTFRPTLYFREFPVVVVMQIIIPTRGRTNQQFTLQVLPPELRERTTLVCPKREAVRLVVPL